LITVSEIVKSKFSLGTGEGAGLKISTIPAINMKNAIIVPRLDQDILFYLCGNISKKKKNYQTGVFAFEPSSSKTAHKLAKYSCAVRFGFGTNVG